jgi:hypothetical protein
MKVELKKRNTAKKHMALVLASASALFIFGSGEAQALQISLINSTDHVSIANWFSERGGVGNAHVLEDFEGVDLQGTPSDGYGDTRWYNSYTSDNLGTFHVTNNTLPGTGSSSYATKTGNDGTMFEIRDYDADGRFNVWPWETGEQYLDSADISKLKLNLNDDAFTNLFFAVTDPGDIAAVTRLGVQKTNPGLQKGGMTIPDDQPNGSLWFVGIDAGAGDYLTSITLTTKVDGEFYTDDGYGVDGFGTMKSVPEPATALLLGAGLLPLMGFLRRKKEDEV